MHCPAYRPYGKPTANKFVVVTPSSLVDNWRAEFKKWLGNERCRPVTVNVTGKVHHWRCSPPSPGACWPAKAFHCLTHVALELQDAEERVTDFCQGSAAVHPVLIVSYEVCVTTATAREALAGGRCSAALTAHASWWW